MRFIALPKNPVFVRALRLNRELKIKIARLAGQLADAILYDRVARFIAVGDRIAETLDFFLHPLERQLATSDPTAPQRTKNDKTLAIVTAVAWSDPLDDEIALAAATLDQLSSRHRGFDGSLLEMNERLEALSQELSIESL